MSSAVHVIQLLVEAGADVHATNFQGRTPLHVAAEQPHGKKCVLVLLAHGASVDVEDVEGWTPRGLAEFMGHSDIVEALVEHLCVLKGKGTLKEFLPAPSYRSQFYLGASKVNFHCRHRLRLSAYSELSTSSL